MVYPILGISVIKYAYDFLIFKCHYFLPEGGDSRFPKRQWPPILCHHGQWCTNFPAI